jgi:hypothetical protein
MLADIERALDHLSAGDHAKLRHWLDGLEDRRLEDRIEHAAELGDDGMAAQLPANVLADREAGSGRRLPTLGHGPPGQSERLL